MHRKPQRVTPRVILDQLASYFDEQEEQQEQNADDSDNNQTPDEYCEESETEEGEVSDVEEGEEEEDEEESVPTIVVQSRSGTETKEHFGQLACVSCFRPLQHDNLEDVHMSTSGDTDIWTSFCKGSCIATDMIIERTEGVSTHCSFCGEDHQADADLIPRYNAHYKAWFLACRKTCPNM